MKFAVVLYGTVVLPFTVVLRSNHRLLITKHATYLRMSNGTWNRRGRKAVAKFVGTPQLQVAFEDDDKEVEQRGANCARPPSLAWYGVGRPSQQRRAYHHFADYYNSTKAVILSSVERKCLAYGSRKSPLCTASQEENDVDLCPPILE